MQWSEWRPRLLALAGTAALLAAVSLLAHRLDEIALAALAMPSVLYGGVIVAAAERFAVSRLLGAAAMTSIVPAAYAGASGAFDLPAALLWISLAGSLPLLRPRRLGLVPEPAPKVY